MVPWLGGNCGAGGDLWGAEGQGSFLRRGGVQKTPTTFTTLTDGKRVAAGGLLLALVLIGCDTGDGSPTAPSAQTATVRFDYRASTSLNPILTPASPTCVSAVGHTHIHPSWRGFARVDMQAVGADLWQITFTDVPVDERLSIRISDANVCDKNANRRLNRQRLCERCRARRHRVDARVGPRARVGVHRGRDRDCDAVVGL